MGADVGVLLLAAAVTFLPGPALLLLLGVRKPVFHLALAPTVSLGILGLIAVVAALVRVEFGAELVGGVLLVLVVAAVLAWLRTARDRRWRPSRPSLASVCGAALGATGAGVGIATWLDGLGDLGMVAQEHDMILHQLLVSYIDRTGRAAPWQVMPADLLTGGAVFFYPAGGHRPAAVLADLGINPVVALNATSIALLAVGWATSVAALTLVAARRAGLSRDVAALAAGVAALVGATLYRPVFQLVHDGGLYSNAVAFALAPGLLAAVVAVPPRGWRVVVPVGIGAAGIVSAHPSAAVTVGVSAVAWFAAEALSRDGRRRLTRIALPLVAAGVVAAALLLPSLAQVAPVAGGASSSGGPDIPSTPFADALGSSLGTAYGGYIDLGRTMGQLVFTVLYLAGVAALLWRRRGVGLLAAWLAWLLVTFAFFLSPARGIEAPLTAYFYNAALRVWSHVALFIPSLAGLGVVLIVGSVAVAVRRRMPRAVRARPLVALGTVAVAVLLLLNPIPGYRAIATEAIERRYEHPDFTRVTADDLAAIAWLDGRVRPGQRVLNSANDGSTFLYVEAGIPVVNVTTLGVGSLPYTYRLLDAFNTYPRNEEIRRLLTELNIAWVYVDAEAPTIGATRATADWLDGAPTFSTAPGLRGLDSLPLPGLDLRFRAGSVSVYHLDLDVVRAL